ncbi:hypothetical protein [Flavobacterium sp.]|uniref:hypothetical protein n=1 Tax=Flavobacterium sp. TaxID=239 RepID=UPI0038FC824A
MSNIFNSVYRQDYLLGYEIGLNPFSNLASSKKNNNAYSSGYENGRSEYENLNGSIANGIPNKIVTDIILEEFLLAGMLGINIDYQDYTDFQMNCIEKWYQSGLEKYDPNESIYLLAILEQNGIYTL